MNEEMLSEDEFRILFLFYNFKKYRTDLSENGIILKIEENYSYDEPTIRTTLNKAKRIENKGIKLDLDIKNSTFKEEELSVIEKGIFYIYRKLAEDRSDLSETGKILKISENYSIDDNFIRFVIQKADYIAKTGSISISEIDKFELNNNSILGKSVSRKRKTKSYFEGMNAVMNNVKIEYNPYQFADNKDYNSWIAGWKDGRKFAIIIQKETSMLSVSAPQIPLNNFIKYYEDNNLQQNTVLPQAFSEREISIIIQYRDIKKKSPNISLTDIYRKLENDIAVNREEIKLCFEKMRDFKSSEIDAEIRAYKNKNKIEQQNNETVIIEDQKIPIEANKLDEPKIVDLVSIRENKSPEKEWFLSDIEKYFFILIKSYANRNPQMSIQKIITIMSSDYSVDESYLKFIFDNATNLLNNKIISENDLKNISLKYFDMTKPESFNTRLFNKTKTRYYFEGLTAFLDNAAIDDNPYSKNYAGESKDWKSGWNTGQKFKEIWEKNNRSKVKEILQKNINDIIVSARDFKYDDKKDNMDELTVVLLTIIQLKKGLEIKGIINIDLNMIFKYSPELDYFIMGSIIRLDQLIKEICNSKYEVMAIPLKMLIYSLLAFCDKEVNLYVRQIWSELKKGVPLAPELISYYKKIISENCTNQKDIDDVKSKEMIFSYFGALPFWNTDLNIVMIPPFFDEGKVEEKFASNPVSIGSINKNETQHNFAISHFIVSINEINNLDISVAKQTIENKIKQIVEMRSDKLIETICDPEINDSDKYSKCLKLVEESTSKCTFSILGYDNDSRPLWQIAEVQTWIWKWIKEQPYCILFVDFDSFSLICLLALGGLHFPGKNIYVPNMKSSLAGQLIDAIKTKSIEALEKTNEKNIALIFYSNLIRNIYLSKINETKDEFDAANK
jgi:hypothetical protein